MHKNFICYCNKLFLKGCPLYYASDATVVLPHNKSVMADIYSCVATGAEGENKTMDLVELDKFSRDQHAVVDGECVDSRSTGMGTVYNSTSYTE